MKKLLLLLALCTFTNLLNAQSSAKSLKVGISVRKNSIRPELKDSVILAHVSWGRKKKQCHGNGICIIDIDNGPHCPFGMIKANTKNQDRSNQDAFYMINGNILRLFFYNTKEKFEEIIIDENLAIDYNKKNGFFFKFSYIKAGRYIVKYNKEHIGELELKLIN